MLFPLFSKSSLNLNAIAVCEIVLSVFLRFEALKSQAVNTMGLVEQKAFERHEYDACLKNHEWVSPKMAGGVFERCRAEAVIKTQEHFNKEHV